VSVLRQRLRSQWLADRPHATVAAVVTHTAGVQAQDTAAARLAVRARSRNTTAADVRRASRERAVVRTWLMRGTLHLVAAEDVRWMLGVFGPRNVAGGARRRRQLGLDDGTLSRAMDAIPRVLADGNPLSRAELVAALARRRVDVDPSGQAPAHLVAYAAAHGLICRGPDLDGDEPGYVLLDDWVPAGHRPADPEAELARRYLGAYGPATAADFAAWSGLPAGTAKRAWAEAGPSAKEAAPPANEAPADAEPTVRLLGAFDTYLLGYRDRSLALDSRYAKRIQAGGGIIHPAVTVDGRVVGRWRLHRERGELTVEEFETPDPALEPALRAEAADIGRFLDREVSLAR
jgi:hypothetical protein